jgi:dUTP pyrophosphatase
VIEVSVRRLRDDAILPRQAYEGDAGLDLAACERVLLGPGERAVVPTGIAVEIPDGYAGFVQPRSGLASRHGIGVVNSPGLIDSGYRGEIRVVLLVVAPVASVQLVEVDELAVSERGSRGFGSSADRA